jgi:hypothetical protein
MAPRLNEASIDSLSEQHDPQQHTFDTFGVSSDATFIGVVSKPTEEMKELTDEIMPCLGMPEKYLSKFLKRRSEYRMNSAIDNPTNRAYDDLELDDKYTEHVRDSEKAQSAIASLVSRLDDGEEVTLVCYEESHQRCHRHLLMEMIDSRSESDFQLSVALTA